MVWPFSRFGRKKITSNPFYREVFQALESKTGVNVNWRTAMEAVTAMACARVISEGLAQIPCKLFSEVDEVRTVAKNNKKYKLIHDDPNDWMTSYDFFETMGLHLVFAHNFYCFINHDGENIYELLPFEPQQVTVKRDGWTLSYEVFTDTKMKQEIPAANMWHIRGPSWNTWEGLGGVKLAREAIGLAVATQDHGARIFKNGAKIGGLLSSDQMLNKDKAREVREAWDEVYGGNENTARTAVVWGGLKYEAMQMLNDNAQFNETRKFQVEEVCRAFRVMPIMVGYSDKTATYASAEQMFLAHVVHTMGPWYARIERSANKFLLSKKEKESGHYFKFLTQALMRGASKDRAEYYSKALGSGGAPAWMTQDEVRGLEELKRLGGSASELPIPTNVGGGTPPAGDTEDQVDA